MTKKATRLFVFILTTFLLLSTLYFDLNTKEVKSAQAVNGILDLSSWDFQRDGAVALNGEWLFYPNVFAVEALKTKKTLPTPYELPIPFTLNQYKKSQPPFEERLHGTVVLKVILPESEAIYGLKTNLMLTAYELYVNDQLKATAGKIGSNKGTTVQTIDPTECFFEVNESLLTLTYQVADYHLGDMTFIAPKLGFADQIAEADKHGIARDLFLFGSLFIIGLYHLGLYAMRREELAPFYFALLCLSFSLRGLFVGNRYLTEWVSIDLVIYIRWCYVFIIIGAVGVAGFIRHSFKMLFKQGFLQIAYMMSTIFILLLFVFESVEYDRYFLVYIVCIGGMLLYTLIKLFFAMRKGIEDSAIVFLGLLCLIFTYINDVIFQYTVANKPSMMTVGVFIFVLCQSLALSSKFARSFKISEALVVENQKMLAEIKVANLTLETRVEERTASLKEVMSHLEKMAKTDGLTQLHNRRSIYETMENWSVLGKSFYIILADIDDFKSINDTYGHGIGDEVLVRLSNTLVNTLGDQGLVGRWGGEEFLLIVEAQEARKMLSFGDTIRQVIKEMPVQDLIHQKQITVTLGMCFYDGNLSVTDCIRFADESLYKGKRFGKNRVVMYEENAFGE